MIQTQMSTAPHALVLCTFQYYNHNTSLQVLAYWCNPYSATEICEI